MTVGSTGLLDCGNWANSAEWQIPSDAVSGVYLAKLTRADNGGSSHIAFVVRDDASTADLFFKTSDATWQAYNVYGDANNGKSLYTGAGGKASKVSYNRPFYTREGGGGGGAEEDWLFNAEYPMIRFLEKNGYDISYTTDADTDRRGSLIQNHKVFMSVGHDEYWSKGMRDNVTAARDQGINLAFFSGNEIYWKTRWENSIDGSNTSYRTLVCYKEGLLGENQCNGKCDPSPEWTGLWRSGCEYPSSDGCDPENELTGQLSWDGTVGTIQVPSVYKNLRFWRNTSVASLGNGQSLALTQNSLGYEWNPEQEGYRATYPAGRIILSETVLNGKTHHLTLYKHSSGALVFGAGTVQWAWGLDSNHARGNEVVSPAMQQATVNLFADMRVQPTTLQSGLVAASASSDAQVPTVTITSPGNGATTPSGTPVNITGTASDANVVAGVEVSTDGGTTWRLASGTTSWTYAWTPTTQGAASVKSRSFDDSGNISAVKTTAVTVTDPNPVACPCSVFQPTDASGSTFYNDGQAIQLGMRFRSTTDGYITGVRFYKQAANTGTHIGQLYSNTGSLLAQATFTNESASGWQQVGFASPVAITANTTYVISYHSSAGNYSATNPYFDVAKVNGPLRALANGEDGLNGIYKYAASPTFPTDNYQSSNYFVDVVFTTQGTADTTPPAVASTVPQNNAANVNEGANVSVTFNEAMDPATVTSSTVRLLQGSSAVAATVAYNATSLTATLNPSSALSYSTTYTIEVKGGSTDPRVKDVAGNALATTFTSSFTTRATPPPPPPSPNDGPGGPILVLSTSSNPFSRYAVEILRAEGFNEFAAKHISEVNSTALASYDVVILGEMALSGAQVTMLTNWVNSGGTLIAFKPDAQLASLLGIAPATGTLSDQYIKVNTASGPGVGIVGETMQFHGTANLYTLVASSGAKTLATLYSAANTATSNPAVTLRDVGTNGGKAIAFTYDLAKSIVYTRQGNPAWAGQKRDGQSQPIRSDDMFYPDWVDLNKVAIPQADEQQRLLANIILQSNMHKKPLPRFWYLPRGLKAAIVMTGDDHGNGGTIGRFNDYIAKSPANTQQAVDNWTAIRSTSYIYPGTPITDAQAAAFEAQGFEISLHLNTGCANYTPATLRQMFTGQLADLAAQFPSISQTTTHRTHCIAWSDWATQPKVELENGIRLDANYYYWPAAWVNDRPGMFTGSGMPMRFADADGSLIDVYQATTQMTDESGITYATHIASLLDNALSTKGYYGVFTANMHTDANGGNSSNGSNAIIAAALQRQVPVVSSKQMLTWLDGRNNSSFGNMSWSGKVLSFTVTAASGSNNLRGMVPMDAAGSKLTAITLNGGNLSYTTETIKGIAYAFFPASNGTYRATYEGDNEAPQITAVAAAQSSAGTATITWTTDKASSSRVDYGTAAGQLNLQTTDASAVTSHSMTLSGLASGTTYYYRVTSTDAASNTATSPAPPAAPKSFTTPAVACFSDLSIADFNKGTAGASTYATAGGVKLMPQVAEEFTTLPPASEWQSFPWSAGGASTVANGQVSVDGARYNTEPVSTTFGPGASLEFVAMFGASSFQHIGFGAGDDVDMFNNTLIWAMFSTGNAGTGLQARVRNGSAFSDFNIPGSFIGASHSYRINWNTNNVEFYIDGALVHTETVTLTTPMRVGASDYTVGGPAVSIDWLYVTPYVSSGSFTSRVYDGGGERVWDEAAWTANLPTGTSLAIFQRQGNTPTPDNSWTAFKAVPASGATVGGTSRYIQYRADLSTSNTSVTPTLQSMSIGCSEPPCPALTFTPASGTVLPTATAGDSYTQTVTTAPTGYTFKATGLPAGLSINSSSGVISGKPTAVVSNATITVTATQNTCSESATYTLSVKEASPSNQAPVLTAIGGKSVTVGQQLNFTASATDPDAGQQLSFSLVGAPTGAAIAAATGAFSWTPTSEGTYTFSVRVTDNGTPVLSDEEQITVTVSPAGGELTLSPVADAFVRGGSYASTNYGSEAALLVKATSNESYARNSYLKFSLSGVSSVVSAKLRVYGSNTESAASIGMAAYGVANDSWTEQGITWNNAPVAQAGALSSVSVGGQAVYHELDVTDFVQAQLIGDKIVSLLLRDPANRVVSLSFNSKESSQNKPQLVIETSSSNHAPVLAAIGDKATKVGQALNFTATATDADAGQVLAYSLVNPPTGATINASSGAFSWTPTSEGVYSFRVRVTDNGTPTRSDEEQIAVTVSPASGGNTQVVSLTLINAATNVPIRDLVSGDELNLAELPTKSLNIRANTSPSKVGSVKFNLTGTQTKSVTESVAPYALFGDDTRGSYYAWAPAVGSYTLQATPYEGSKATGAAGIAITLSFTVTDRPISSGQRVISMTLVNADNDNDIMVLTSGATLNLASLPTKNLNIRANTSPSKVGSVKFNLTGTQTKSVTESVAPYALFGDDTRGGYYPWTPAVGNYTLNAVPYSGSKASGTAGEPLTLSFTVINGSGALVTGVTVGTGRSYTVTDLAVGKRMYTDRTYQITSVPASLQGATLIQPPNDDKRNTSSSLLTFNLTRDATVYVAYDPRGTSLPSWLSSWQRLSDRLGVDDSKNSSMVLFSKSFPSGKVTLGGNMAAPAVGAETNYLTIALSTAEALSASAVAKASIGGIDVDESALLVYPNPSSGDKAFVELNNFEQNEAVTLTLYDVRGRAILTTTAVTNKDGSAKTELLFAHNLNKGVYILTAVSKHTKENAKLVVR
ncbi:DUF4082 domain-containing protein [Pontibacter sp. E15-1]|nr:DUF4082 domain-containing protein [Pontibacter sp. E15-1]